VCGSDTYLVHKAIICPQSDFFRAACRPDTFQEGSTNIINITASRGRDKPVKPDEMFEFDWDLDVETTASVKLMIHYFYHHNYLEKYVTFVDGVEWREGFFDEHSRMYAMGEKYGIPGLKCLALAKFGCLCQKKVRVPSVIAGTVIAFNSTPELDKDLRKEVLRFLHGSRRTWTNYAKLHAMILSMPEVAYGLYLMSIERDLLGGNDGMNGMAETALREGLLQYQA
jgi:hypothetical protein